MRKVLSRLMFTAVVLLALVYFLAATRSFRINGAGSVSVCTPDTGTRVTVTETEEMERITRAFTSLRWRMSGSAQAASPRWQVRWYGSDGALLEELALTGDHAIILDGRLWTPLRGSFDAEVLETLFSPLPE